MSTAIAQPVDEPVSPPPEGAPPELKEKVNRSFWKRFHDLARRAWTNIKKAAKAVFTGISVPIKYVGIALGGVVRGAIWVTRMAAMIVFAVVTLVVLLAGLIFGLVLALLARILWFAVLLVKGAGSLYSPEARKSWRTEFGAWIRMWKFSNWPVLSPHGVLEKEAFQEKVGVEGSLGSAWQAARTLWKGFRNEQAESVEVMKHLNGEEHDATICSLCKDQAAHESGNVVKHDRTKNHPTASRRQAKHHHPREGHHPPEDDTKGTDVPF